MTDQLCLKVLGPIEAWVGDRSLALGGPRQRALLAVLTAHHPTPVSLDRLADAIWSGEPPVTFQATVHAYVSRLRKLLTPWASLVSEPQGYRLVWHRGSIDAHDLVAVVDAAQRAMSAGRPDEVVALLEPAQRWWRSAAALEGWESEAWAREFCAALAEQRLVGAELLAEARLQLNQPRGAVAELEGLVSQRPYAESAVRLLMVALYRDHRQADALRLFDHCRHALADELGIDPSPALQQTHQQVLAQHPQLDWAAPPRSPAPRMLPPRTRLVVGREGVIAAIGDRLAELDVVTLYGLPGSGKTTVAAEIAHQHQGLVCWVPAEDSAAVLNALAELAGRLGVPAGLAEA